MTNPSPFVREYIIRQAYLLTKVRWVVIGFAIGILTLAVQQGMSPSLALINASLIAAVVALNAFATWLYRREEKGKFPHRQRLLPFVYFHTASDLIFIIAAAHFTGGPYSPAFFLLMVYVAALALNYPLEGITVAFVTLASVLWGGMQWLYFYGVLLYHPVFSHHPVRAVHYGPFSYFLTKTISQIAMLYIAALLVLSQSKRLQRWWARAEQQRILLEKLNLLSAVGLKFNPLSETAHAIAVQLADTLDADSAFIAIWSPERQCLVPAGSTGFFAEDFFKQDCLQISHAVKTASQPFWSKHGDGQNPSPVKCKLRDNFSSFLVIPLEDVTNANLVGVACAGYITSPAPVSSPEWLAQVQSALSLLISKVASEEREKHHLALLQALAQEASTLATMLSKDKIATLAVLGGKRILNAPMGAFYFYSAKEDKVECLYHDSALPEEYVDAVLEHFRSIPGSSLLKGKSNFVAPNLLREELPPPVREKALKNGILAIAGFSTTISEGTFGALTFYWNKPHYLTEEEIAVGQLWATRVGTVFYNATLYEYSRRESLTDPLTGLPNRRALDNALLQEWKRAHRYSHPFAVVMVDLNNFKSINDTYGHLTGDIVLQNTAAVLREALRETDILGRWGGDEFLIILPEATLREAEKVIRKLLQQFREKAAVFSTLHIKLTFSFGIAIYPEDGETPEALVAVADKRLYENKRHVLI